MKFLSKKKGGGGEIRQKRIDFSWPRRASGQQPVTPPLVRAWFDISSWHVNWGRHRHDNDDDDYC